MSLVVYCQPAWPSAGGPFSERLAARMMEAFALDNVYYQCRAPQVFAHALRDGFLEGRRLMLTPDMPTRELASRLGGRALSFGEAMRRVELYEAAAGEVRQLVLRLGKASKGARR